MTSRPLRPRLRSPLKGLLLALILPAFALQNAAGNTPLTGLRQLTGLPNQPWIIADPAIVPQPDGSVLVMGTGNVLRWRSMSALLEGESPSEAPMKLFQRLGTRVVELEGQELPWDLQIYDWQGRKLLYGGVMHPRAGSDHARWPDDNISRRIKVAEFDSRLNGWVFGEEPVFGSVDHENWVGHSYGHQNVELSDGWYMFHDQVSRAASSGTITEIFARKLGTPRRAGASIKILGIESLPRAATSRVGGGHLLEGPRYQSYSIGGGRTAHVIYFSTGDFPTKNYTTMAAYSLAGPLGPYEVYSKDGEPVNLTQGLQERNHLHGVGRAFPFRHEGKDYVIFHGARDLPGVDHGRWPETLDSFRRVLFVAPIEVRARGSDAIDIRISAEPQGGA